MKKYFFVLLTALCLSGANVIAQTAFRHVTSAANTSAHITTLDHAQLNGNPNAILQVTADFRNVYNASNVGVWYNGTKWTIYNQDKKVMSNQGLQFNVMIVTSGENHFIHVATADNVGKPHAYATTINHPKLNNNPSAIVLVTQNYGANNIYNTSEIAVWYTGQYWNVYNENQSRMPAGASFNVSIITPPAESGVHLTAASNIWGQVNSATETAYADPQKLLFITHNGNQSDWNPNPCGIYYPPGRTKWSILTGNTAPMPVKVRFNIVAMSLSQPARDLTGFYRGDSGNCGQAYIRQIGNNVYWFGEHPNGSFGHVFSGTISGNTLTGNLWDVPKGTLMNKGNCVYSISADGNTLTLTGGTIGCNVLSKTTLPATLPASRPMQAGSGALTGVWDCNDGAATYVREDGNDFIFFSEAKNNGTRPGFANLYIGKRNGNTITGNWIDVPKGTHLGSGAMTLRVESDTRFVRVGEANGYGGGVWTRISDNFPGTTKISIRSPLTNKIQNISVKERNGLYIYQGDIIVGKKNAQNDAFTNNDDRIWNNGVIPYSIEPNHPNIAAIQAGINMVNNLTNLCLIPRINDRDFIYFKNGNVCQSWIGRIGGSQDIIVGLGCDAGTVAHEILHAAGFFHEQSRADRDAFVSIIWENILPDQRDNFEREGDARSAFPYDFVSIMHYRPDDFSINGAPTIVARVNSPDANRMGQSNTLSSGDIRAVNFFYPRDAGCSSVGNNITFTPADLGPFCPTALLEGDRDFSGHGPAIVASVNIQISADRLELEAIINFRARETTHDWSTTEGRWTRTIYTAPPGRRIMAINSETQSSCDFISGAASAQFGFPGGGNTVYRPPLTGSLARVFEIVGDTGGDDISSDNDCGDDTRITVRFNPISLTLGSR